jgi:tetratricopeptide (TPR) repeat protein
VGPARSYRRWLISGTLAALAVLAAIFLLFRSRPDQSHPPIAIVEMAPFAWTGDSLASDTAKASDGVVADMLTNSGLPVLRPRLGLGKAQAPDLRLAGQVRTVGERVEADLQLDDLTHGTLLLSRRFSVSRDQANNLPEQMGAFAATSLATTGAMMALDRERPGDRRLTGEVLRQWSNMVLFEDPASGYQAVERIARQMPNSAVAQLALAMSTSHVLPLLAPEDRAAALAKGRAAAARARELAPNYGDVASPDCTLYPASRMAQCEASLRKAFAIDPDSPFVAAGLRNELVTVGRFREALAYDRLAVAAMPYMAGRLSASTMLLEGQGLRQRAAEQFERGRRWWPEFNLLFSDRLEGILDRGSIEDAAHFVATMPANVDTIDRAAVAATDADVVAKRAAKVRSRCLSASIESSLSYFCLVALIKSNDLDGAFIVADRLFPTLVADDPNEEDRIFLNRPGRLGLGALSAPALKALRQDPRFLRIAERVGLMRYWRQNHLPDFCDNQPEPVCSKIAQAHH